ncbi:MAG: prolipoprotein diacylglyceryl transferase [Actinobacteria bacterium]|nr:prolipoprotein diacylglyceryl transferase [Actinomycetota bacterium]
MSFFDPLAWEIIPRINLGPLAISPHGIGIAIGYLLGAQLMVRRSRRFGGPDESDIWNMLFYALIGAIVGARVGYVLGHLSEVTDGGDNPLGVFEVWKGGISLLGGITGAVLFSLPYAFKHKMGFWRTADLAVPGLALGIVIGRIGDLMIGDHLGRPTSSPFGWRCLGASGEAPVPYPDLSGGAAPPSLGCFDQVVHQTALYDFVSTLLLLGLLLFLGRKVRRPGFLTLAYVTWYTAVRMATDFLRVDRRYFGLTGSQITSLLVGLTCLYLLARYRGAPPRWGAAPPISTHSSTESDEEPPKVPQNDHSP